MAASEATAKRWTTRELLAWTTNFLKERSVESPRTLAEMLLASVLQCERLRLYMEVDREASADELSRLRALVMRAGRHEPIQFLLGQWTFHGREYEVAPCTLIPRPETEMLVDEALRWMRDSLTSGAFSTDIRVADIGTGTGCVAISFAAAARGLLKGSGGSSGARCRPLGGASTSASASTANHEVAANLAEMPAPLPVIDASTGEVVAPLTLSRECSLEDAPARSSSIALIVNASDIVPDAIALAQRNATRHGLDGAIDFRVSDLFSAYSKDEQFDLIVSNPPYIMDSEWDALDANVREYEPASALRGGSDGLVVVRRLLVESAQRLRTGGLLLVEIGWKQGEAVRALAKSNPQLRDVSILKDSNGIDRFLRATRA
ncbi:MAG: peptide chain release factor N(5)-glutamine methyltransferase [Phycisphaerales bacterium]|nr:peptide chain release factor N(5)-glutamine methyltransferase [Phycisphaerales bacterium]